MTYAVGVLMTAKRSELMIIMKNTTLKVVAVLILAAIVSCNFEKNKNDWLYGRVEVRAKLPAGRGTWPAIWMLSTDWEYGGWPESGEVDIMENVGYNPDSVFVSVHTETYNHRKGTQKTTGIALADCDEELSKSLFNAPFLYPA